MTSQFDASDPKTTSATPALSPEQARAMGEAQRLDQQVMQLYQQGKFNEAISLAERVIAICKRTLGENHPEVATRLDNLAGLGGK